MGVEQSIVREIVKSVFDAEFGESEWWAADVLIFRESGWNAFAVNKTSGACGLFQFLPCSKMKCIFEDVRCQARAGASYIKNRYITPSNAYSFWKLNFWY